VFALVAIVVGILLGLASGGGMARIGELRLKFEWAILVAFLAQAFARGRVIAVGASSFGTAVWVISSIALIAGLLVNGRTPGCVVAGVGVLLNLDVVLLNGAMPVVSAGIQGPALAAAAQSAGFYRVSSLGTLVVYAGDSMPFWLFGQRYLVSPGDVLLCVGVVVMLAGAMLVQPVVLEGASQ
jgi:hypothetical protein